METSGYVDLFATKGQEYIFIIGFIIALFFFWRFLNRTEEPSQVQPDAENLTEPAWEKNLNVNSQNDDK